MYGNNDSVPQKIGCIHLQRGGEQNQTWTLRNDCHIVGSASQKLCLFQFLPFVIDLEQCPTALRLYALAREVVSYALSRCISRDDLDYFEQKVVSLRECVWNIYRIIVI